MQSFVDILFIWIRFPWRLGYVIQHANLETGENRDAHIYFEVYSWPHFLTVSEDLSCCVKW